MHIINSRTDKTDKLTRVALTTSGLCGYKFTAENEMAYYQQLTA